VFIGPFKRVKLSLRNNKKCLLMVHTRPFIYRPVDILRGAHVEEYVGYLSAYRQQSRDLPSMICQEV
jgi:choline kinase